MLTYDDELALSDRLVARRQVRDKLCAEERAPRPKRKRRY